MGNLTVNRSCGYSSTIDTIFGQWLMIMRRRCLNVFSIYDPSDFILTKITLPHGCPMPNINAFRPVVHEFGWNWPSSSWEDDF